MYYFVPINVWGGSYSGNRNTLAVHPHQLNTQHFRIMDLDKLMVGTWKVKKNSSGISMHMFFDIHVKKIEFLSQKNDFLI